MSFLFPIIALAAVILGIWLTGHLARKRRAGTGDYSLECPTDSADPPDRRIDFSGPLVRPTTAILKSQLARRVRATWRRSEQIDYAAFELDGVSIALRVSYRDSTAASPATPSAATTSTAARSAATASATMPDRWATVELTSRGAISHVLTIVRYAPDRVRLLDADDAARQFVRERLGDDGQLAERLRRCGISLVRTDREGEIRARLDDVAIPELDQRLDDVVQLVRDLGGSPA